MTVTAMASKYSLRPGPRRRDRRRLLVLIQIHYRSPGRSFASNRDLRVSGDSGRRGGLEIDRNAAREALVAPDRLHRGALAVGVRRVGAHIGVDARELVDQERA